MKPKWRKQLLFSCEGIKRREPLQNLERSRPDSEGEFGDSDVKKSDSGDRAPDSGVFLCHGNFCVSASLVNLDI